MIDCAACTPYYVYIAKLPASGVAILGAERSGADGAERSSTSGVPRAHRATMGRITVRPYTTIRTHGRGTHCNMSIVHNRIPMASAAPVLVGILPEWLD
jgi:hypothetical protein